MVHLICFLTRGVCYKALKEKSNLNYGNFHDSLSVQAEI
jgi:hypothetical protein